MLILHFEKEGIPGIAADDSSGWRGLTGQAWTEEARRGSNGYLTNSDRTTAPDWSKIAPPVKSYQGWNAERGLSRRLLRLAIVYMEEHIGESFTLEALARAVGISRFHFSRLFRRSTGTSPMEYALHLRIEYAKGMLRRGDRKACDIATTLGFFDQSHFSRTFRRMTGVSPGEYVRMCDAAGIAI